MNALWKSPVNFMFWKSSNFAEHCLRVVIVDVHMHIRRVVILITAVNRDAVRHNMLLFPHIIAWSKSEIFLLILN